MVVFLPANELPVLTNQEQFCFSPFAVSTRHLNKIDRAQTKSGSSKFLVANSVDSVLTFLFCHCERLSLLPSLPVAHCITFIPVFHPAPCHSPKRSLGELVSPHPLTIFTVSCSAILLLGGICRHINPNPAAWHLRSVEPGRLCCTSLKVQRLSEGKTVVQTTWVH